MIIQNFLCDMKNKGFRISYEHELTEESLCVFLKDDNIEIEVFPPSGTSYDVKYVFGGKKQYEISTKEESDIRNKFYSGMKSASFSDIISKNLNDFRIESNREIKNEFRDYINKIQSQFSKIMLYAESKNEELSNFDPISLYICDKDNNNILILKAPYCTFNNEAELDYGIEIRNSYSEFFNYVDKKKLVISCNKPITDCKLKISNVIVLTHGLSKKEECSIHNFKFIGENYDINRRSIMRQ